MKRAILYEKLSDNRVKCLACQQYCRIFPGRTGICGVRRNEDGDLYLLVYGKAAAFHVDPMEKKPLYHFLPGKAVLSLGTIGCDFACQFCQNWDISQSSREIKRKYKDPQEQQIQLGKILDYGQGLLPEKIVEYAVGNNIPAIAYTYNEPAIFFEYAYDTAKLAHEKGIKNIFVSNGYESKEALEMIEPYLDAMNIDLKAFTEEFYLKVCQARLGPVLETIKRCRAFSIWLEVTTLVIPGKNDSAEELTEIAEFLVSIDPSIPWHVSRFHPDYKMLDVPPTPIETLHKAYNIGKKAGLKYIYVGNVLDPERESTYCPKCGCLLIKRSGYSVEVVNLERGRCIKCREKIEGVWE